MAITNLFDSYAIASATNVILKSLSTKEVVEIDFVNTFSGDVKTDTFSAKRKGVDDIYFDKASTGTLKLEMEEINTKLLTVILASKVVNTGVDVLRKEILTADATGKVTLTDTPIADSLNVYIDNGETELKAITSGTPLISEYKITGKDITTIQAQDTEIIVYYLVNDPNKRKFTVNAVQGNGYYELFADVLATMRATGAQEMKTMHYFRVKPKKNFSFSVNLDKPVPFVMDLDVMPNNNMDFFEWIEE